MDGGPYEGSITLVSGISGTGKTVLGVQFLACAAMQGRKTLLVTLDEHPQQMLRNAATVGFDLATLIDAGQAVHPLRIPARTRAGRALRPGRADRRRARHRLHRLRFRRGLRDDQPEQAADFLYALANYCKNRLATVFFNYESPELLGISQISQELKGSHLVDNIILLSYVRDLDPAAAGAGGAQVPRQPQRSGDPRVRDRPGGLALKDVQEAPSGGTTSVPQLPFSSYYGLLSRSPSRQSPVIEEAVTQGSEMPPSEELQPEVPHAPDGIPDGDHAVGR